MRIDGMTQGYAGAIGGLSYASPVSGNQGVTPENENSPQVREAKRTGKVECKTCKERKYQDGSDEMVSFKAPTHMSPQAAASGVRAHEQEHVANAYKKASQQEGKVLQASVRIKTAVCPECGKSYVAGGVTSTRIKYNEKNPYEKNAKSFQAEAMKGNAVDMAV